MKTSSTILKYILLGFTALGAGLALFNFAAVRSLWLDEAYVALNIVNKSWAELFQPLDYGQVAPIGFLLAEKFFASLFGGSDWSLRIWPLLAYLACLPLLYKLALKVRQSPNFALFCTALFSLSYPLIRYSAEVKQYISDVTIGLLILFVTTHFIEKQTKNRWFLCLLTGIIAIWFSNIAIILITTASIYLIQHYYTNSKNYQNTLILISSWMASFLLYYSLFIHDHPSKEFMVQYWTQNNAFIPQHIFSIDFYNSLYKKGSMLFSLISDEIKLTFLTLPVFAIGLLFIYKKKSSYLWLLILPILFHLGLSFFKMYPFDHRLILYLTPLLIIGIAAGLFYLFDLINHQKLRDSLQFLLTIPLVLHVIFLMNHQFPIEVEEIKRPLAHIESNIEKGDAIYVYYSAKYAFEFYKPNYPSITDKSDTILIGHRHRKDWDQYEKDIENIQAPVWLIFSHLYWGKRNKLTEKQFILNLFKKHGLKVVDNQRYKGASVYKMMPKGGLSQ